MSRSPHDPHETDDALAERIRRASLAVRAPDELQAHIAATHAAARPSRAAPYRGRRPFWTLAAAAATVAVVALVAVLVFAPGAGPVPTVDAAATLALRTPSAPAPAPDPGNPRFVDAAVGSVHFPSNAYTSSATPSGSSEAKIAGRRAVAVTYGDGDARVGYTVVDGAALPIPRGTRRTMVGNTPVWSYERDGAQVVTWQRDGHTCVVASRTVPLTQLLRYVGREA